MNLKWKHLIYFTFVIIPNHTVLSANGDQQDPYGAGRNARPINRGDWNNPNYVQPQATRMPPDRYAQQEYFDSYHGDMSHQYQSPPPPTSNYDQSQSQHLPSHMYSQQPFDPDFDDMYRPNGYPSSYRSVPPESRYAPQSPQLPPDRYSPQPGFESYRDDYRRHHHQTTPPPHAGHPQSRPQHLPSYMYPQQPFNPDLDDMYKPNRHPSPYRPMPPPARYRPPNDQWANDERYSMRPSYLPPIPQGPPNGRYPSDAYRGPSYPTPHETPNSRYPPPGGRHSPTPYSPGYGYPTPHEPPNSGYPPPGGRHPPTPYSPENGSAGNGYDGRPRSGLKPPETGNKKLKKKGSKQKGPPPYDPSLTNAQNLQMLSEYYKNMSWGRKFLGNFIEPKVYSA